MWDTYRWVIADQNEVLNGDTWGGIKIYKQDPPSTEFTYAYYVYEKRTFTTNM